MQQSVVSLLASWLIAIQNGTPVESSKTSLEHLFYRPRPAFVMIEFDRLETLDPFCGTNVMQQKCFNTLISLVANRDAFKRISTNR